MDAIPRPLEVYLHVSSNESAVSATQKYSIHSILVSLR